MALSYGVTDFIEGGVITAVIVLNVVIGFYQEFQAEKKMVSFPSAPNKECQAQPKDIGLFACSILAIRSCHS